ncbi:methyl-accepting chemotaxis protein [Orenia metallireducens]|jgi:methyl-accepting chemotaxis protein|uniref:Methyl-accepting chemotaxis protein n=1 Tax=Orenia metallireducens TaxID=1413210 RepID=A0A285F341_9FIRM|nr:methyl-accepting chemotaxis protein [Orenia metallireducens]SNY05717.1 methyl-accepting chemotaxis protein [Orenia metallireducens]
MLEFLKRLITLRNKLLLFILVPIILVGVWNVQSINKLIVNNVTKMVESNGSENVKNGADVIANWLRSKENELLVMSKMVDLEEGWSVDEKRGWRVIKQLLKVDDSKKTDQFMLMDLAGKGWTSYAEKVVNLADRDYFQRAKASKGLVVSDPRKSELMDKDVVVITIPVKNANGKIIAYLGQSIPLVNLEEIVNGFKLGDVGYAYLVQQDGEIFAHPSEKRELSLLERGKEEGGVTKKIIAGEEGFGLYNLAGDKMYAFYHPIEGVNWSLVLTAPKAKLTSIVDMLIGEVSQGYLLLLIIIFIIIFLVTTNVSKNVKRIDQVLDKMAKGDFSHKIKVKGSSELSRMAHNINKVIDALGNTISSIKDFSLNIANSSDEIAEGNNELSDRTQNNASALEEVSATIEEINSSMQEVSSNSEDANRLSQNTMKSLKTGSDVVSDTIEAIGEISDHSERISEIIVTVNEIASQTNLLALNAAVEAARANENGKGFAVVADEVRSLAERTAESANEIEKLIKSIIKKILHGNNLVNETGSTLKDIVENSKEVHKAIRNISISTGEQASAIEQTQQALEEINQGTQDNAAMVEEIASSSEELNRESVEMAKLVEKFKVRKIKQEKIELLNLIKEQLEKQGSIKKKRGNKQANQEIKELEEIDLSELDLSKLDLDREDLEIDF